MQILESNFFQHWNSIFERHALKITTWPLLYGKSPLCSPQPPLLVRWNLSGHSVINLKSHITTYPETIIQRVHGKFAFNDWAQSGSPTALRVFNSWCKGWLGKSKEPNCVQAISDKSCVRGISVSACLKNFLSAGDSDLSQRYEEPTNQKDIQASNTKWIFLMVEVVARARVRWHPGVICSFQNRWACARGGRRSWSSSFSGSFGLGEDEGDHVFDWRWIRLRASRGEKAGEDWLSRGGMDDGRWRGDKFKIVEDEAADDDSD